MKKRKVMLAAVTAVALSAACTNTQVHGSTDSTTTAATETTQQTEASDPGYAPGVYAVGDSIPAGEYLFYSVGDELGVITVRDGLSSEAEEIGFTVFRGNAFATLEEGTYIKVESATFSPTTNTPIPVMEGKRDVMYRVGIDIPAGVYNLTNTSEDGEDACVLVKNSSVFDYTAIESRDDFESTFMIELLDGQYVEFSDCKFIIKED